MAIIRKRDGGIRSCDGIIGKAGKEIINARGLTWNIFTGEIIAEAEKEEIRRGEREFLETSKELGRSLKGLWNDFDRPVKSLV